MALRLPIRRSGKAPRTKPDEMTLLEHLGELRRRILISAVAVLLGGILAFAIYSDILNVLMHPYCSVVTNSFRPGDRCSLLVTSPLDGLNLRFKVAVYGGIFFGLPVILYQLWKFITPGLNPNERRYVVPFMAASLSLFALGAGLAYLVMGHALKFLQEIGGPKLTFFYQATSYLSFILALMAAFGVAFEFPVVLVALELLGVVSPQALAKRRRIAIVVIFAVVAVFIPSGDPFSLLAMTIPLVVFYEGAIVIGRLARR